MKTSYRRLTLLPALLVSAVSLAHSAAADVLPAAPVALVADLSAARTRIPGEFLGLSLETNELLPDGAGKLQFTPDNLPLRTLLQTMGVKNLRFGGNATDAGNVADPTRSGIDAMFGLARAIDAGVIYTVRFSKEGRLKGYVAADPQAAAEVCRHILANYPERIRAFTIGNEPDMYFSRIEDQYAATDVPAAKAAKERSDYEKFRAEWKRFAAVIRAANPTAKFNGPSTTGKAVWGKWFAEDFAQDERIAFFSNHWYPGGNGKKGAAEPKLKAALSPEWHQLYAKYLAENGFAAMGGRPFRIEEMNSYYYGGAPHMSDSMAAALWALDFGHWFAAHGCAGLNFHTCTHLKFMVDVEMTFNYASFIGTERGYLLRPIGYGLMALALGSQGDAVPLAVETGGVNLSAHAVAGRDGHLYVTLINKEYDARARPAPVRFSVKDGQLQGGGESLALVAPGNDVRAKSGITLGGAPVAEDGSWAGRWAALPAAALAADGTLSVVVPPSSALLIRLPFQSATGPAKPAAPIPAPAAAEPRPAPERGFVSSQPAANWENALVSGNGKFGALVFGQPLDETIVLNHARLFMPLHEPLPPVDTAGQLPEIRRMLAAGDYQRAADFVVERAKLAGYGGKRWTDPFVPAFDVRVKMSANGAVGNYSRTVDFATGVAAVNWSDARGEFQRQVFVSRPDDVVVLAIKGPQAGSVDCELQLTPRAPKGQGGWGSEKAFKNGVKESIASAGDGWLTYRSRFRKSWPGSLQGYEGAARVVTRGGTTTCENGKLLVRGADEVLVLTRIELLPDDAASQLPALKAGLEAITPDFAALLARHAAVHGKLFRRTRLDLGGGADRQLSSEELLAKSRAVKFPSALLEKEFDAARYAVLSSSGELFPNLQGIWGGTYGPPWSGDFTLNGNVQCALGANLSGNLAECLLPFFRFLEAHLADFRTNARRLYGCRGIHVPSRASSNGLNNHFDETWPMTFWTCGAGWASQFFYDYYLYTGDQQFLRERALPFMKEAALFYEDFLITGPDGKLLFSPSYSPENHPANSPSQACINATMDLSVARELLRNCIAASETMGGGADDIRRWRALLAKMPDYQISPEGAVKEWSTPLLTDNYAHRHASHLYALYNGLPDEIAANAPLLRAFEVALEKRLDVRRTEFAGGKGPDGRPPGEMAFGIVQQGLAAASLHQGEDCGEVVNWLSHHYWRPNFVTTHNPGAIFNTDLCGGLPALLIRMLVESQPGWIELLPAVPKGWPAGKIEGIRARGQIEVRQLAWGDAGVKAVLVSDIAQSVEVRFAGQPGQRISLPKGKEVAVEFTRPAPQASAGNNQPRLNLSPLRNPVWTARDNLRDPSVLKTDDGYYLFYSRFLKGAWSNPKNWVVASVFTKDFVHFENDHDISPKGFASPGDVVSWHGRWLLPYQNYPASPVRLCFSESRDLTNWSAPKFFLAAAAKLPWNTAGRVIDPSFVVAGDTLHCFFIGSGFRTDASGKSIRGNLMGHAITRDPKLEQWEILTPDAPLIGFSATAPDGVENAMIFRTGGQWTMIYSEGLEKQHLALATSPDLLKWKLEGPIEIPRQKWMSRKFGAPFVWKDAAQWMMILMGTNDQDRTTFGLLTSPDGRQWDLLDE